MGLFKSRSSSWAVSCGVLMIKNADIFGIMIRHIATDMFCQ